MTDKQITRWSKTITDLTASREQKARQIDELKAKKRPLTLSAHTGDAKARAKLDKLNTVLLAAMQDLEDLDEAVSQAQAKLADAERALAEKKEAERLRRLSALAQKRVDAAIKVDEQLQALATALTEYGDLGSEIRQHLTPSDEAVMRKLDGSHRLDIAVARILGDFVPVARVARNPLDPRKDESLTDMERGALSTLLINPEKADKLAALAVATAA